MKKRLSDVRRELHLTQKKLALELQVRTDYIGQLECGAKNISAQFLNRLCMRFPQVNRAYIEFGTGKPILPEEPETPEEHRQKLIQAIKDVIELLDPPAREVVFEAIRQAAGEKQPEPQSKKTKKSKPAKAPKNK